MDFAGRAIVPAGSRSGKPLVGQDSQGEDVCAMVDLHAQVQHLRGSVFGSEKAFLVLTAQMIRTALRRAGKAKVHEFHHSLAIPHDVLRFDITMHDAVTVSIRKAVTHLTNQSHGLFFSQRSGLKPRVKSWSIDPLQSHP